MLTRPWSLSSEHVPNIWYGIFGSQSLFPYLPGTHVTSLAFAVSIVFIVVAWALATYREEFGSQHPARSARRFTRHVEPPSAWNGRVKVDASVLLCSNRCVNLVFYSACVRLYQAIYIYRRTIHTGSRALEAAFLLRGMIYLGCHHEALSAGARDMYRGLFGSL